MFLAADDPRTFDNLPDPLTIYRGGDASNIAGVFWSTYMAVAESCAIGHRGIKHPDPVILSATVSKGGVLLPIFDRQESEMMMPLNTVKACQVHHPYRIQVFTARR